MKFLKNIAKLSKRDLLLEKTARLFQELQEIGYPIAVEICEGKPARYTIEMPALPADVLVKVSNEVGGPLGKLPPVYDSMVGGKASNEAQVSKTALEAHMEKAAALYGMPLSQMSSLMTAAMGPGPGKLDGTDLAALSATAAEEILKESYWNSVAYSEPPQPKNYEITNCGTKKDTYDTFLDNYGGGGGGWDLGVHADYMGAGGAGGVSTSPNMKKVYCQGVEKLVKKVAEYPLLWVTEEVELEVPHETLLHACDKFNTSIQNGDPAEVLGVSALLDPWEEQAIAAVAKTTEAPMTANCWKLRLIPGSTIIDFA